MIGSEVFMPVDDAIFEDEQLNGTHIPSPEDEDTILEEDALQMDIRKLKGQVAYWKHTAKSRADEMKELRKELKSALKHIDGLKNDLGAECDKTFNLSQGYGRVNKEVKRLEAEVARLNCLGKHDPQDFARGVSWASTQITKASCGKKTHGDVEQYPKLVALLYRMEREADDARRAIRWLANKSLV